MKIKVEVEIDPKAYEEAYYLHADEVKTDAQVHLKNLLEDKIIQLGYASKNLMKELSE